MVFYRTKNHVEADKISILANTGTSRRSLVMKIGVPKEIKNHEYRVGLVPASVRELAQRGHDVYVQATAGQGIGVDDREYEAAGASILPDAESVFETAEMIVKVKERYRTRHFTSTTPFTYLHLAPDAPQTEGLIASGATCIAYKPSLTTGAPLLLANVGSGGLSIRPERGA
jgi:alanine dehydrogenase